MTRRPGRPRKNGKSNEPKLTRQQREANKGKIAPLHEGRTMHLVYTKLLEGKDVKQIAQELDITEGTVRKHRTRAIEVIREDTAEMVQAYQGVTLKQIDGVLSRLLLAMDLDAATEEFDNRKVTAFKELMDLRKQWVGLNEPAQKNTTNIQINNVASTFGKGDPLYAEAAANVQESLGQVHPVNQKYIVDSNPEVDRLDGLAFGFVEVEESQDQNE